MLKVYKSKRWIYWLLLLLFFGMLNIFVRIHHIAFIVPYTLCGIPMLCCILFLRKNIFCITNEYILFYEDNHKIYLRDITDIQLHKVAGFYRTRNWHENPYLILKCSNETYTQCVGKTNIETLVAYKFILHNIHTYIAK